MQALAPNFTVSRIDAAREIHWSARGLWTQDKLDMFQAELYAASEPFIKDGLGFRVLADLRDLAVQQRDVAERIRKIQEASAHLGVKRIAIVISSILVKQQFRRVSEALDCEFFPEISDALAWLRS